jgi:hypothetical protein
MAPTPSGSLPLPQDDPAHCGGVPVAPTCCLDATDVESFGNSLVGSDAAILEGFDHRHDFSALPTAPGWHHALRLPSSASGRSGEL